MHITTLVDNVSDRLLVNEGPALDVLRSPSARSRTRRRCRRVHRRRTRASTRCARSTDSRPSSPSCREWPATSRHLRHGAQSGRHGRATCAGSASTRRMPRPSCSATGTSTTQPGSRRIRAGCRAAESSGDHPSRLLVATPARHSAVANPSSCRRRARRAIVDAGFDIIEDRRPSFLLDGSILITGEVDRTTSFEKGFAAHQAYRDDALGAGSAHPRRPGADRGRPRQGARRAHGLRSRGHRQHRPIRAATDERERGARHHRRLPPERCAVRRRSSTRPSTRWPAIAPDVIVPAHCTGTARGAGRSRDRFPDAFIQNSVGTRFELASHRRARPDRDASGFRAAGSQ